MAKEEVKKTTKKTVAKATKKAKVVEIVDEIKDDIEVEVDKVEITPKKTYKELKVEFRAKKHEIEVEILNLNHCATTCRDRGGRIIFEFNKTGDREFISLADATEVATRYKGFFEKHQIAIIDVDTDEYAIKDILTYLNLNEIYEENEIENYDTDYIVSILKMDTKKFKRFIEDSSMELAKVVAGRAVEMFRAGKFDSRIKEEALCSKLNREDLFEI